MGPDILEFSFHFPIRLFHDFRPQVAKVKEMKANSEKGHQGSNQTHDPPGHYCWQIFITKEINFPTTNPHILFPGHLRKHEVEGVQVDAVNALLTLPDSCTDSVAIVGIPILPNGSNVVIATNTIKNCSDKSSTDAQGQEKAPDKQGRIDYDYEDQLRCGISVVVVNADTIG